MTTLRGFGLTFDTATGRTRSWYIDREGVMRWADNDEVVARAEPATERRA